MDQGDEDKKYLRALDVLERNTDGYLVLDRNWMICYVNPRALSLLNAPQKNLFGDTLWDVFPELASNFFKKFNKAIHQQSINEFEGFYPPLDKWFLFVVYPYSEGLTICLRDVTELKHESHALRESELRFRTILESVADGIILIDDHSTIILCNPAVEVIFGYAPSELIGRKVSVLMAGADRDHHSAYIRHYFHSGKAKIIGIGREVVGCRRDGSTFPLDLAVNEFCMGDRRYFVGILRNITERKKAEAQVRQLADELESRVIMRTQQLNVANQELEHLAWYDSLTGLPNRTLFHKRLTTDLETVENGPLMLILLMIDLNRFKEINDTLGHHVGDLLLQAVSTRLQKTLRESDTIARLGGDEFAIILLRSSAGGAEQVAKKITAAMLPDFQLENNRVSVKASIGLAVYPEHGNDQAGLLKHADVAMYEAKKNALDYVFYDSRKDPHAPVRLTLIDDLFGAMSNGSLVLFYQPKIALGTGQVVAMEALLRWQHHAKGMIYPDVILPLAQQGGFMEMLTAWVLDNALQQCAQWNKKGLNLQIEVNLAAQDLQQKKLLDDMKALLDKWGLDAKHLILDITEAALISSSVKVHEILVRLDSMGVRLSVDDYGTGYASLAYIKKLPIHEIKIDRSLIKNLAINHEDVFFVKSIIELSHHFGFPVVAEGVEDMDIYVRLKDLSCDFVQGYIYTYPLPMAAATRWLSQYEAVPLVR